MYKNLLPVVGITIICIFLTTPSNTALNLSQEIGPYFHPVEFIPTTEELYPTNTENQKISSVLDKDDNLFITYELRYIANYVTNSTVYYQVRNSSTNSWYPAIKLESEVNLFDPQLVIDGNNDIFLIYRNTTDYYRIQYIDSEFDISNAESMTINISDTPDMMRTFIDHEGNWHVTYVGNVSNGNQVKEIVYRQYNASIMNWDRFEVRSNLTGDIHGMTVAVDTELNIYLSYVDNWNLYFSLYNATDMNWTVTDSLAVVSYFDIKNIIQPNGNMFIDRGDGNLLLFDSSQFTFSPITIIFGTNFEVVVDQNNVLWAILVETTSYNEGSVDNYVLKVYQINGSNYNIIDQFELFSSVDDHLPYYWTMEFTTSGERYFVAIDDHFAGLQEELIYLMYIRYGEQITTATPTETETKTVTETSIITDTENLETTVTEPGSKITETVTTTGTLSLTGTILFSLIILTTVWIRVKKSWNK